MDRRFYSWIPLLALVGGCVTDEKTALVPDNPLRGPSPAQTTQSTFAPATTDVAARVDLLGRNLVAANPQLGIRPLFRTIGAPQPEIFHRGTADINITEGLVRQCVTDGQLAALLCLELGKMVAEREALAGAHVWQNDKEPPPDVAMTNDSGLSSGPDMTRQAELAKFRAPARREPPPPPPDPESLARVYLQKAGYPATDLDAIAPLLKAADGHSMLEKSMTKPAPATWGK